MVKSVVTGLCSNHYFTQSDEVRDTSIEDLLMKMFEHDFFEPQLQHRANKIGINYDKLLRNDRGYVHSEEILKDEEIRLPNNRAPAMKHLESLRKKFKNDDRLFKEYSKFMEELVEKRYARKCDGKGPDGKT